MQRETELTAFFKLNEEQQGDHQMEGQPRPTYVDMPKLYKYDKSKKKWVRRQARSKGTTIGRVHKDNYNHCRGKTSFADMKRTSLPRSLPRSLRRTWPPSRRP